MQTNRDSSSKILRNKAPFLFVVAAAFFIYELYIFLNSFQALTEIYRAVSFSLARNGFSISPVLWLFSELTNEAGSILRFAGSIFFLAFATVLVARKKLVLAYLRKGILLEGIQYLFIIPFLVLWLGFPSSIRSYEAAASYLLQLLLITPSFILLYRRLRQPQTSNGDIMKWTALAVTCFAFAMWVKHFFLGLYALPINFSIPALTIGFVNSTLTLLLSALILVFAFLPLFRGKSQTANPKVIGAALFLMGLYSVIFIGVAAVNVTYLSFLTLTELWMISLLVAGVSFVFGRNTS